MGLGILLGMTLAATGLTTGCGTDKGGEQEVGTLALSLSTQGPSGAEYRLRDAVFEISPEYYYYDNAGGAGSVDVITVSSEDDPSATSINVSVERGYHLVRLRPGWHLEKIESGETTVVEATLLSSESQWVYVRERASTWVEYQFGLGDRSIWFNGDLNIAIGVYEDPSQLYGTAGVGPIGVGGADG